jgi:hypothetical protein
VTSTIKIGTKDVRVKTLAIVILLVLMIAVLAVAIYKNPNVPEDIFDDPVVQGDKDIGSILAYSIVDSDGDTFDLEIIGQSGSYYFADMTGLAELVGSETAYQMFHKETGALRFAEEGDPVRFEFDGETKDLASWTSVTEGGAEWVFYSCEEDGIPYVIEVTVEDDSVRAELLSAEGIVEPSEDYERPGILDQFFVYSVVATVDGEDTERTTYYRNAVVADDGMYGILELSVGTEEDEEGNEVETYEVGYLFEPLNIFDYIFESMTAFGLAEKGEPKTLDTIDGEITCDSYTTDMGELGTITVYVDPATNIAYAGDVDYQGEKYAMELVEYDLAEEE